MSLENNNSPSLFSRISLTFFQVSSSQPLNIAPSPLSFLSDQIEEKKAQLIASMSTQLPTTSMAVRLSHVSVTYNTLKREKAPLWATIIDSMKGMVDVTRKRLYRNLCEGALKEDEEKTGRKLESRSLKMAQARNLSMKMNRQKSRRVPQVSGISRKTSNDRNGKDNRIATALEDISTILEPSQIYMILGGRKAGKTSLLKVREKNGR